MATFINAHEGTDLPALWVKAGPPSEYFTTYDLVREGEIDRLRAALMGIAYSQGLSRKALKMMARRALMESQ